MIYAGYASALVMGLILGVMGGGGSILTVPILVYLFHLDMLTATMYSLFIVGVASAAGGVRSWRADHVDRPALFRFGLPSLVTVLATRAWLLPHIPDPILSIHGTPIGRSLGLLLLFAVLMLAAATSMIRTHGPATTTATQRRHLLMPLGLGLGLITGLLGAGGGFLIIPALVLIAGTPMHRAVGTSLLIIAANALIGFAGDLTRSPDLDLPFLLVFTALSVVGILFGGRLSDHIPAARLRPAFGWFVLVMGFFIIGRELSAMT
ncbi:MAG: sulfite exporter TauE/SafE family protein [Bacteroidetes bacterium]|nr:sulfite exporter TauE/SafE family protein [Bacteroidota bacterium]